MKVCLLNDSFPPVIDGVVNVVMNYANYLREDFGDQIMVGTPSYPGADYSAYPYPVIAYPSLNTTAVANGYRTGNPFSGKSVSALAEFSPDIIHSHCPASASVIARLLREECHAPIVFTYHTKYDIDIRRAVKFKPLAQESIKAMVGNIEAMDEVWVVSQGAGESLDALGFQGEWRVMHNGVDFDRGRAPEEQVQAVTRDYDLPQGVPLFLYVGRLITYKGLPLILEALKQLSERGQDFRMVFVGKGPDKELLERQAAELGLMGEGPGKCIFTGPVYERDVLRAWNTRADLFLFPSTFDTNGLVVREAAACGLASVLVRDSCAAEGVTDGRNGFLMEENAQSLAALLERSCQDLDSLHRAGERAMEELYLSWKDCVHTAHDRYLTVLEEKLRGTLPKKKKAPTDLLVSLTAHGMSGQDKLRRRRQELLEEFKESALGMMENIQEVEECTENFWESAAEKARQELEEREF